MLIKATATVAVEVEVADALIERDLDLEDPDVLIELMDSRDTNEAIVSAFYEAGNLSFELDDAPERMDYSQLEDDLKAWKSSREDEIAWLNRRYA